MKVLFLTHYPGVGGANLSMVYLIKNLRDNYGVVPMVWLPMGGPIETLLKENGINYEIHRYASWRTQDQGYVRNFVKKIMMLFLNFVQSFILASKVYSYNVIYQNSSKVFFGYCLSRVVHKPLIWHLREFGTTDYPMVFLCGKKYVNKVYSSASSLIAISKSIEKYYKSEVCYNGKYSVIYNGIDLSLYDTKRCINPSKIKRICIVGGVDKSKNQMDLIEAASILRNKGYDFSIDLIGADDSEYAKLLNRRIKDLELTNNVHLVGQKNNVEFLLPSYDIGIITSVNEAFGRVIVEYMLSGLAVVGSDTGACPELISDDSIGLLYQLHNSLDLADKIELLLKDDNKLKNIAQNGRCCAIERYSAKINASKVFDLLKTIEK